MSCSTVNRIHVLAVTVLLATAPLPLVSAAVSKRERAVAVELAVQPLSFVVAAVNKTNFAVTNLIYRLHIVRPLQRGDSRMRIISDICFG